MRESKRTRIGLVGCGFYGQNHLHAWSDLKPHGADLVAVCDQDPDRAQAAGRQFGASPYDDLDTMLDEVQIDLLDIATRMDSHRSLARNAAERGIATIVQKPFAPDLEECRAIVETAGKHGTWLAVHENFRFGTGMRRVRALIDEGTIGTPNWARIAFRTGYDIYRGQPYLALEERFSILDSGIHVLDLARFFLGEVDRLYCETQSRKAGIRGEDTATMLLRHSSGAVSVVETTYEAHRIPDSFPETVLEIEGAKGSIILSHDEVMTVTSEGAARTEPVGPSSLSWTSPVWRSSQVAVLNTNAHMLAAFRSGRPAETSGADNLRTFELVEAAYLSAETHESVRLPLA